jgi:hypothetical protein
VGFEEGHNCIHRDIYIQTHKGLYEHTFTDTHIYMHIYQAYRNALPDMHMHNMYTHSHRDTKAPTHTNIHTCTGVRQCTVV